MFQLYKIYNGEIGTNDWLDMNLQQNFNSRSRMFRISDCSKLTIGKNILANRLTVLNNQINLDWLNFSLITFKLKVKSLFLSNWLQKWTNEWKTWIKKFAKTIIFLNCKLLIYFENKTILILILTNSYSRTLQHYGCSQIRAMLSKQLWAYQKKVR